MAAVGFSAGGWVTLSVAETRSFELFDPPSNLRFRAAVAFNPPCQQAAARPAIPTLILVGALDDWTPAADCSNKIARWGTSLTKFDDDRRADITVRRCLRSSPKGVNGLVPR